jgi:hypothetical protein
MKLFCTYMQHPRRQGDGLLDESQAEALRRKGMATPQRHHDDLVVGGANNRRRAPTRFSHVVDILPLSLTMKRRLGEGGD